MTPPPPPKKKTSLGLVSEKKKKRKKTMGWSKVCPTGPQQAQMEKKKHQPAFIAGHRHPREATLLRIFTSPSFLMRSYPLQNKDTLRNKNKQTNKKIQALARCWANGSFARWWADCQRDARFCSWALSRRPPLALNCCAPVWRETGGAALASWGRTRAARTKRLALLSQTMSWKSFRTRSRSSAV